MKLIHALLLQPMLATLSTLPPLVREDAILAGGALRALFDGTKIKDYDIFFRSEEAYASANILMSQSPDFVQLPDAGRTTQWQHKTTKDVINLIGFAFGTPEETIGRFDMRCCHMALYFRGDTPVFLCRPEAEQDCYAKRLVVLTNNGTERTLRRIDHYVEDYGYKLDLSVVDHLQPEEDIVPPPSNAPKPCPAQRYVSRLPTCSTGGY